MQRITSYNPLDVSFIKGQGIWLYDTSGDKYLDAVAGIGVNDLGHAHPKLVAAISEQASKLIHTSNLYHIEHQEILAERLCTLTGLEQVFFNNSGAEANETALKLARLYGHKQNIDHPIIVVVEGAFHGRTLATLSASGSRKVQAGFEPLVSGFARVPYNDVPALETIAQNQDNIVAVLVEPILGEGGVVVPDRDYLTQVQGICHTHNWLLILDEIQTGLCRTGAWFAHQHANIKPDVMTLAKALGNGIPIGACVMGERATDLLLPGMHGSTFGGNPLSCRMADAVLGEMDDKKLHQNAQAMGQYLEENLTAFFADVSNCVEVRGLGLMIGIELDHPCVDFVKYCLAEQLLINVTADCVIRLLPPLIITQTECDMLIAKLKAAWQNYAKHLARADA